MRRRTSTSRPGDYVALIVTDSGTGMPPDVIERGVRALLHHQERRPRHRARLEHGLWLRQAVARPRQDLQRARSRNQHQAVPAAGSRRGDNGRADRPLRPPHVGGGETILVVEDDAAVRIVAVSILENLGYRVREAEDGHTALDILKASGPDRSPVHRSHHAERHERAGSAARGARATPRSEGAVHVGLFGELHRGARQADAAVLGNLSKQSCGGCSASLTASRSSPRLVRSVLDGTLTAAPVTRAARTTWARHRPPARA